MNQIELEGIVRRAAKGEKQAIEILYNTYREKLYFFVLKNVDNKDLAEDIIEETFLSAMQNINRLKDAKKYESCFLIWRARRSADIAGLSVTPWGKEKDLVLPWVNLCTFAERIWLPIRSQWGRKTRCIAVCFLRKI